MHYWHLNQAAACFILYNKGRKKVWVHHILQHYNDYGFTPETEMIRSSRCRLRYISTIERAFCEKKTNPISGTLSGTSQGFYLTRPLRDNSIIAPPLRVYLRPKALQLKSRNGFVWVAGRARGPSRWEHSPDNSQTAGSLPKRGWGGFCVLHIRKRSSK